MERKGASAPIIINCDRKRGKRGDGCASSAQPHEINIVGNPGLTLARAWLLCRGMGRVFSKRQEPLRGKQVAEGTQRPKYCKEASVAGKCARIAGLHNVEPPPPKQLAGGDMTSVWSGPVAG